MAVSALKTGDNERAAALCVAAARLNPSMPEAFAIRGACLLRQDRPFDALLHFDRALDLRADQPDVHNNMGVAFAELGMWDAAEAAFAQALSAADTIEPHMMRGGMRAHLMQLEAAAEDFKGAMELDPFLHDAHIKYGVIKLGLGDWEEGFKHYEWRWYDTPFPPKPFRSFKKWKGETLLGQRILLYSEQGFGDEIMGLRFATLLKPFCADVILDVRPTMLRLARSMDLPVITHGDPYPTNIAYSCPLFDVPMVLGVTPNGLPRRGGYLIPQHDERFRERLATLPRGLNVGLCWSSGLRPLQPETQKSAKAKSVPLDEMWKMVGGIEGINYISLQIPKPVIPPNMPIHDWSDIIDDFQDTAALIDQLDLTITVDTSVAHLAGAIGAPVWNLVRFNGYWPWLKPTGRTTPWYNSMVVYRQPELGDWLTVGDELRRELYEFVAKRDF